VPVAPAAVDVLAALVGVLPRWGPWYLFGAQAVVAYGVPRLSADVDVTLRLTPDSPDRFVKKARSGASRASLAIRCSFVETVSEIGVFVVFPSSGSVPRCSSSLHGVPRVGSPASSVLLKHSDSPLPFPLRFVAFVQRYRGGVPRFALTGGRTPDAREPGPFVAGGPPGALPRGHWGLPGSWTNPCALALALLRPRGDRGAQPFPAP
jgi:hypothetical protein